MTRPGRPSARPQAAARSGGRATAPDRPADVVVADPAYADVCARELGVKGRPPADGVFVLVAGALKDACFAHQVLPRARLLRGAGPSDLANAVLDSARDAVFEVGDVQVTAPEVERQGSHARGAHPLDDAADALRDVLRKKVEGRAVKHGPRPATGHTLRVLVVDAWGAWVSVERRSGPALLAWPAAFPGGRAVDERARDAPSSAHRKIDEALLWLEDGPGEGDHVVDLGAAPGGWSQVMLERGAEVVAVDRADLDEKLAQHPRLTHVRSDAFTYEPPTPPSWWLCDVIAEPARSLDIARQALLRAETRGLVITLKLTRPVDLAVLAEARRVAQGTTGFVGRVKQLAANKLEVTLMMKRAG